jgi:hypothetical protein
MPELEQRQQRSETDPKRHPKVGSSCERHPCTESETEHDRSGDDPGQQDLLLRGDQHGER